MDEDSASSGWAFLGAALTIMAVGLAALAGCAWEHGLLW